MAAVAIVASTVLSYILGWMIGRPIVVPILNTLASYPFMLVALRRGNLRLAIARMLLWALTMGVCATLLSYASPWRAGDLFLRGASYRTEMFVWVMTGRGVESTPSQFIPQHLRDAALFAALALATGGLLAMPLGALLMNQMGVYAGSLAAASVRPAATIVLAWHPWAVIRIVSFVAIGVVLSQPMVCAAFALGRSAPKVASAARRPRLFFAFGPAARDSRWLLVLAGAGLVIDVAVKTTLAPLWRSLLLRVAGW